MPIMEIHPPVLSWTGNGSPQWKRNASGESSTGQGFPLGALHIVLKSGNEGGRYRAYTGGSSFYGNLSCERISCNNCSKEGFSATRIPEAICL